MKIHNVRLGFATNSSSSHSIVIVPKERHRSLASYTNRDNQTDADYFGQADFVLATPHTKMRYLGEQLHAKLAALIGPDMAATTISELLNPYGLVTKIEESTVDHESAWNCCPVEWDKTKGPFGLATVVLHKEFIQDLAAFMARPDVVVLGGSDSSSHSLSCELNEIWLPFSKVTDSYAHTHHRPYVLVRRDSHGWWSMFNTATGAKVRLSFSGIGNPFDLCSADIRANMFDVNPDKSDVPELVDLKITDWCDRGCSYCYQNSSTLGKHAPLESVVRVADALAELKTFEVAIGGGEPTKHPAFLDILKVFRDRGIIPNFSTRNLDIFQDPKVASKVLHYAGSFAVSVDNAAEADTVIKKLACLKSRALRPRPDYSLQYVVGGSPGQADDLQKLCKLAGSEGIHVTLLGFKTRGRAANQTVIYDDWFNVLKKFRVRVGKGTQAYWVPNYKMPEVSVDTCVASRFQAELDDLGVARILYDTTEGRFSMYIDAVNNLAGPSSFCEDEHVVHLDLAQGAQAIKDVFGRFTTL